MTSDHSIKTLNDTEFYVSRICKRATSERQPTIKDFFFTLVDNTDHKLILDKAFNKTKFWTKVTDWSELTLKASSHYIPEIDKEKKPNYITDYTIGIDDMDIGLTLLRGTDKAEWSINGGCTNFAENCDKEIKPKYLKSITSWQRIFKGNFMHGDRIEYTVSAKNGGKVLYEDRSSFQRPYSKKEYDLIGIKTTEFLELEFDTYPPVHCFEQSDDCKKDALKATDFLTQPKVTVQWDGWSDSDSGVEEYVFNIYTLKKTTDTGPLMYGNPLNPSMNASSSYSSLTLELDEPGPYSIEIITYDQAGNDKVARRIVLFDNASVVDLHGSQSRAIQATANNWINKFSDVIEIVWPGRFRNVRHSDGGWLNEVPESKDISRDLDDRHGRSERTIEKIDNIDGIIRFEIAYLTEFQNSSTFSSFQRVPDEYFHSQKMIYTDEKLIDGKRLTYCIRGYDVVGEFAEDNVTVMIDLSPPVIQNLWLTKGDLVNISVHSVLELKELTIEWETFDYHSGIHEVSWKVFDNFTKDVVVYGNSNEPPQGETKDLKECNQKYGLYPRGPNCYCSPYNGCFHRHYQIKPPVSNVSNAGLHFGKEIGEHDYDYYIEVTVINSAGLSTTKHKKITIDTSPPHEGKVYDGILGDYEVDFQQSLKVAGHWNDFFDKESGVWLYSYGFSENCLDENDLDVHSKVMSLIRLYLNRNREIEGIANSSKLCRDKATTVQEFIIKLYPLRRCLNGTIDVVELNEECNELHGVHSDLISYITSDSK
ncbi:uncharacterized protein LOC132750310, partial [Ruditapes philippinarum]|uniref:uncharacterized protein LOC132750310 n=1 Tax=Ruditapes philippinarum TaxID=129788 RepID=UPI00295B0071